MLRSFTLQNFQSFISRAISLELNRHTPEDGRSARPLLAPAFPRRSRSLVPTQAVKRPDQIAGLHRLVRRSTRFLHQTSRFPWQPIFQRRPNPAPSRWSSSWTAESGATGSSPQLIAWFTSRVHTAGRAFSYVFTRDWNSERKGYVVKQQQFGLLQREAEKVRENASLISTAAQYEVDLALKLVSANVLSNVHGLGRQGHGP